VALLVMAPEAVAGEHVRAGDQTYRRSSTASAPAVRRTAYVAPSPVTISIAVQPPARTAVEPVYVTLRGPDGQVRRFPIEGGSAAIQSRQVVLHPGESLTVVWARSK
jgi:hypothetical protein